MNQDLQVDTDIVLIVTEWEGCRNNYYYEYQSPQDSM